MPQNGIKSMNMGGKGGAFPPGVFNNPPFEYNLVNNTNAKHVLHATSFLFSSMWKPRYGLIG
jgi:hypothetical protein